MSETLEQRIHDLSVAPGTVACVWLGQAGYLLKTPAGAVVMIDPYLSDYAEAQWGMKRVIPPPIDPDQIQPDLLLISHWHEDHLDAGVIRRWGPTSHGVFAGPCSCAVRAPAWGWPAERVVLLDEGMSYDHADVEVQACFARHETPEAPSPEAVGYLLRIGGLTLWAICDTEYDARLRAMASEAIDVCFTPINGVGGNMTDKEAALLLSYVKPKLAIPNHYNMWAPQTFGPGATLDPAGFVDAYTLLGGGATRILDVGEIVTLPADHP